MATTRITKFTAEGTTTSDDEVVLEEPLEIRLGDRPLSVTLRTPGDDLDLAAGFVVAESVVRSPSEIGSIRHWGSPNVVRVDVGEGVTIDWQRLQRHFYATSSCGVCGKVSIDALKVHASPVESDVSVSTSTIIGLPLALQAGQESFAATGAIHAAGIFSSDGSLLRLREDVGRHNAVDKVIGSFFRDGESPRDRILMVSGRTSFEILQKAIVARIPIVAAVGAPSSLAVDLAREFNITLLGFVRDGRFNVYSGEERVSSERRRPAG